MQHFTHLLRYFKLSEEKGRAESYSMKLFMAPRGLQETKMIFFKKGEFRNALITWESEIQVISPFILLHS